MPRIEPLDAPQTFPEDTPHLPPDLPEMPAPGATTGNIPVVTDAADPAKYADDDVRGYQSRS